MKSTRSQNDDYALLHRWSRQIASRPANLSHAGGRRHAAIGYVTRDQNDNGLVELEHLTFVVVSREPFMRGRQSIRVAGFSGTRVPWGVMWGGPANNRFCKDLSLPPIPKARGRNLDLDRPNVVDRALCLERRLDQQYPCRSRSRRLRLPRLWAALEPNSARDVTLDGPELIKTLRRTGMDPTALREQFHRFHHGFILLPLDWVSHGWRSFAQVFADLRTVPKQQVVDRVSITPVKIEGARR